MASRSGSEMGLLRTVLRPDSFVALRLTSGWVGLSVEVALLAIGLLLLPGTVVLWLSLGRYRPTWPRCASLGSKEVAQSVPKGRRMKMDGTIQYSDSGNQLGAIHCNTMNSTAKGPPVSTISFATNVSGLELTWYNHRLQSGHEHDVSGFTSFKFDPQTYASHCRAQDQEAIDHAPGTEGDRICDFGSQCHQVRRAKVKGLAEQCDIVPDELDESPNRCMSAKTNQQDQDNPNRPSAHG